MPAQDEKTRRRGTVRATIIEYLEAGWTDLPLMWSAIERDHKWMHITWSYLQRIAREWRAEKAMENQHVP